MKRIAVILLELFAAFSCRIVNDLDYPVIPGEILSISVEGQKSVYIDKAKRTVHISLEETADLSKVKVLEVTVNEDGRLEGIGEYLDLRKPVSALIKTYQDYTWTITGELDVERYIRCANQIGDAQINPSTRTALVYVSETQTLSAIVIEAMKLEPEGAELVSTTGYDQVDGVAVLSTESCSLPRTLNCVLERVFTFSSRGETVDWKFKALQLAMSLKVDSVIPYCYHAKVRALFDGKGTPEIQFRPTGEDEWTGVESTVTGVGISADITGLQENTGYQVRVICGDEVSDIYPFKTDRALQLDNLDFDTWELVGKVWNPFITGSTKTWDTANKATASFLGNASTPDSEFIAVHDGVDDPGKVRRSVRLESSYAVVKFASGSIFTGSFVSLKGLGAELSWGIPYTSRPSALKGYIAYEPKVITDTDTAHSSLKGQMDTGHVIMILTDWEEPFHVISSDAQYVDFENDPSIIAYGRYALSESTGGFIPFELPLDYRSERTPRYLVIVGASSALGDYFTGGRGSVLWLDDFSLVYE